MSIDFEAYRGTWIWAAAEWAGGFLGAWWWLALIVFVIVVGGFFSVAFIAKGGGQYGIIEGYVGTIGAGKTTLAVQHALMLAKARRAVLLSNIPVVCGPTCKAGPGLGFVSSRRRFRRKLAPIEGPTLPVHAIEHGTLPMNDDGIDLAMLTTRAFELRDQERGLVLLMDEVGVIMPSRLWKDFSVALMWVLQQSRKLACEWIWTAQDASFVDHQLRSLTAVVHYVRCFPPPSIWRRVKGKRPWLMIASAFTPTNAPRANGEGMRSERRIGRKLVRYNRAWEAAFDTDGVVLPSRHLKGAEILVDAVRATHDSHVITSDFGPLAHGAAEDDDAA